MTKNFDELEERVDAIAARMHELDVLIRGDLSQAEVYRKHRALGVCPNVPEPAPGAIELIGSTLDSLSATVERLRAELEQRSGGASSAFATKLEAFFGPMLANKNPPLDGNQVATKGFVDEAVARIAGVIRGELDNVRKGLRLETQAAIDLTGFLRGSSLARLDPNRDNTASTWHSDIVRRLTWMLEREEARVARESKPSRISSLIYAVTGFEKNGARR